MAEFKVDRSGDLQTGYFYYLLVDFTTEQSQDQTPAWIVSGSPDEGDLARYACAIDGDWHQRHECGLNRDHATSGFYTRVHLDVIGENFGPFVPAKFPEELTVVNKDMAKRLTESTLSGLEILTATVQHNGSPTDHLLYVLQFLGRPARRVGRVFPAEANKCVYCGHEPLFCAECCDGGVRCDQCINNCFAKPHEHKGRSDPRIVMTEWVRWSNIVEPQRWDGSDFSNDFAGGVITRRALDFFFKQHAAPFKAEPLFVDMKDITDEQRERLELARKPID